MTPAQHNRYLGLAHLGYAGLYCLFIAAMMLFMGSIFISMPNGPGSDGPPPGFLFGFMAFAFIFYGAFIVPSVIAGYGLLKRKRWAKVAAIIAAVFSAMFFPVGSAVSAYTFWFMFSEPGKLLYDKHTTALPPAPPKWGREIGSREHEYVPPTTPPDWR